MTATIISNNPSYTFGAMTNQVTSRLIGVSTQMERLNEAIASASSGYTGEPGTEFEAPNNIMAGTAPNLFGVIPDPDPAAAGNKGKDYAYAMNQLYAAWQTFWTAARPYIEQLDNGTMGM